METILQWMFAPLFNPLTGQILLVAFIVLFWVNVLLLLLQAIGGIASLFVGKPKA